MRHCQSHARAEVTHHKVLYSTICFRTDEGTYEYLPILLATVIAMAMTKAIAIRMPMAMPAA